MLQYVRIPRLMPRPHRAHAAQPRPSSLVLGVAVCIHGGVYIQEITGTNYTGMEQLKAYLNKAGDPRKRYGGEEYSDFLQRAWSIFMTNTAFRRRSQHALVIHDRSPAHTAAVVTQTLKDLESKAELLPPRSPDLQPLDYGIFSTSKANLARDRQLTPDWSGKAIAFKHFIRTSPYESSIRQFKERLDACMRVGGRHIDDSLRRLRDS